MSQQSTPMRESTKLLKAYSLLSDNIISAVKQEFQKGTVVHWTRAGHRQRGEVNAVLGFKAHNLRLQVLNTKTGKLVDLHLYEIEELRDD